MAMSGTYALCRGDGDQQRTLSTGRFHRDDAARPNVVARDNVAEDLKSKFASSDLAGCRVFVISRHDTDRLAWMAWFEIVVRDGQASLRRTA